jgi:outer membrane immunogenic protein
MASPGLTRQMFALWRPWSDLRRTVADMSHLLAPSRVRGVRTLEPGGLRNLVAVAGHQGTVGRIRQGTHMKKLLGTMAILAVAMPLAANAADLPPAPPSYKAPVVAPVPYFSWSGCYIGASGGYGWGTSSVTTTIDPAAAFGNGAPVAQPAYNANMSPQLKPHGGLAGGQVGCNFQSGAFVFGGETDLSWFNLKDSVVTSVTPTGHSPLTTTTTISTSWLWTARGRAGVAFDRAFFYGTGGVAATNPTFSQNNLFAPCGGPGGTCIENVSTNPTRFGWTVGAGVEYAFTHNLTAKLEYLYADFGSFTVTGQENATFATFTHNVNLKTNIVRAGLNWKFDWGGPVVARY